MAAANLGSANVKIWCSEITGTAFSVPKSLFGMPSPRGLRIQGKASIVASPKSIKPLTVSSGPTLGNDSKETEKELVNANLSSHPSQLIPKAHEVESLLKELCGTNSIAEFELKRGGFHLHVTRDLTGKNLHPSLPSAASVPGDTTAYAASVNGSVASTSLAITKQSVSEGKIVTFAERATDEGLVMISSPRVGVFRRSRTIKGKRAPPSCKEKQIVKEGQVICYIEQLGGELPVESDVSGEVVKILLQDGEPVGYGDPVIAILPSFPGIKKLQ